MAQDHANRLAGILGAKFTPGEVIHYIEDNNIKINISGDELLDIIMPMSVKNPEADHGEGYWIDHWHYNLDLLENYLAVYPENLKDIIFEKRVLTFWTLKQ